MDSLCQVNTAKNGLHLCDIEVFVLLENHHLRMIIKSKCLFRGLIINNNGPESWVRLEYCNEIVSEPAFELAGFSNAVTPDDLFVFGATDQFTIIKCSQWIAFRHARDLSILMAGGNEDEICFVEGAQKMVELISIFVPVNLQIQIAAINTAKRIIAI